MNTFDCVPLGQTITIDFVTHGTTGAITDADSTPTSEVFEETTDVAILTPTCTKRTSKTGNYRLQVACTIANGFELGKSYSVVASATVGGIAGKAVVASFMIGAPFIYGTVVANAGNTVATFKTSRSADSEAGQFNRHSLVFAGGSNFGECCKVTNFDPSTDFITVLTGFTTIPAAGDPFVLLPLAIGADRGDVLEIEDLVTSYGETSLANEVSIMADTDDIQARLPAALVGGRMDSSVGAMANNVLTAAAIAADAITAAKIADGAIDTATFTDGAITAAKIADNAITAAKIATNAIDADALAADAVAEIQSGLATAAAVAGVQSDTDDIQTRLPAALVGGRIDASVGAVANNAITAAAIADGAIDAATFAAGAINAAAIAADAITAAKIADGAIDAATFAAGAINAAAIATDAIDADALAADAVAEIQSGLATSAEIAAVQADTDNIQTRLPAALVGGRIDASVGAMAANTLTAAALAADAGAEIADAVLEELVADHPTAGSLAKVVSDAEAYAAANNTYIVGNLDTTISSRASAAALAAVQADTDALQVDTAAIISATTGIQADTDDIQSRLPAALDGSGFMKAQVKGMDASTVTAAAIATDAIDADAVAASAVTEIQAGLATAAALATAQADLDDIQTRLPAALVGGRMDSSVGAVAANAITAAAIADGAIDAATFAAGAINAAAIADGAIDAATFAAGAIDAAAIATDAIGAAEISAAAVTKIQNGLATAVEVAAVQTDVDDIQGRLPAALVGGRIDAHVGAIANDAITTASIADDAISAAKFAADACAKIIAALYASTVVDGGLGTFGRRFFVRSGTVQTDGGNTAIAFLTDLPETDPDYWVDALLVFEDGPLVDQVKKVTAYDGAGGIAVGGVGYTETPPDGSPFVLINK